MPADGNTSMDETRPLLRPMSQSSVGILCIFAVASGLLVAWCTLDGWNQQVISQLFSVGEVKSMHVDKASGSYKPEVNVFNFPLTLAFLQFIFMGLFFTALFFMLADAPCEAMAQVCGTIRCWQWPTVVLTHVFSIFWLQALILPTTPIAVGSYAAVRACEVPAAYLMRAKIFGMNFTRVRDLLSPILMFFAVMILCFSYSRLAECLCVWGGHGVTLTGPAFMMVYVLLLMIPAANVVCQESLLTQMEVPWSLMLAGCNFGAALIFLPIVLFSYAVGFEDFTAAWNLIFGYQQVYMLILWLCVQMTALAVVNVGLVSSVNSFWTVSLRSFRVVFWWCRVLFLYYFSSGADLLSTSMPVESAWSFLMFCGVILAVGAILVERKAFNNADLKGEVKEKRNTAASSSAV